MRCLWHSLTILFLCWIPHGVAAAATLHVPKEFKLIQGAMDAASPGDTILVQPGTYPEKLKFKKGVTLKSAGDDTRGKLGLKRAEVTILDGGGEKAKGPGVTMAEESTLDGFTITRVGLFDQKEYDKHYATQGENLPDEKGAIGTGKEFPALAVSSVTAVVQNCIVHDNGHAGIGCLSAPGKHNASLIFQNIAFRNMGGGIAVANGATPTVQGNKCFQNLRAGIGNRNSNALIVANECFENVRAGIGIREGATPIVRGNKCYKNRRAGIGIRMKGTAPLIENNDCYQNLMAGIGCRDGAEPNIQGNRCFENKLAGIGFEDTKTGKAIVTGNKVTDNEKVAVGIHSGWKVTLSGNVLSRKGGLPPLVMVFKGAEADFVGNTFTGEGVAGIRTEGVIRVVNNQFMCSSLRKVGPPQFAVWGLSGSNIVFTGNKVKGWQHALVAEKATVSATFNKISGYWQKGIRIEQSLAPATAIGNLFITELNQDGLIISGQKGVVKDNQHQKSITEQ